MEITTTVRNSVSHLQHPILSIPWGRGNPADFIFPSKYLCLGAFHICFLLPMPTAQHKQATAILPAQTFVFSPVFLHYVPWQKGSNCPGQRTCLLSPSFIYSGIHTAQREKKSRGLPCKATPAPHSDAEDWL